MGKNREFNDILDECLERLLVEGKTIEECLASYPEQANDLKPLLQTVMTTKKALAIQPRPEFKVKARYQFRTALQEIASRRSRPFFTWRLRWATVVASVLVLLLAGGGVVVAAGGSMPDEPLYHVKLATEQVQLKLTFSALGKAKLAARLADRRVTEIIYMAQKGDSRLVELTTRRLDNHLAIIASLIITQRGEVGLLEESLPLPAPEADMKDDEDVYRQNGGRTELVILLENYAVNHPAKLSAALETAPESVKPALLRAIAVSVAGYEKVLNAIGE